MSEENKLLTWTVKLAPEQAKEWDDLIESVAAETGRRATGRSTLTLTRRELVETLIELARTNDTVRAALVEAVRPKGSAAA